MIDNKEELDIFDIKAQFEDFIDSVPMFHGMPEPIKNMAEDVFFASASMMMQLLIAEIPRLKDKELAMVKIVAMDKQVSKFFQERIAKKPKIFKIRVDEVNNNSSKTLNA